MSNSMNSFLKKNSKESFQITHASFSQKEKKEMKSFGRPFFSPDYEYKKKKKLLEQASKRRNHGDCVWDDIYHEKDQRETSILELLTPPESESSQTSFFSPPKPLLCHNIIKGKESSQREEELFISSIQEEMMQEMWPERSKDNIRYKVIFGLRLGVQVGSSYTHPPFSPAQIVSGLYEDEYIFYLEAHHLITSLLLNYAGMTNPMAIGTFPDKQQRECLYSQQLSLFPRSADPQGHQCRNHFCDTCTPGKVLFNCRNCGCNPHHFLPEQEYHSLVDGTKRKATGKVFVCMYTGKVHICREDYCELQDFQINGNEFVCPLSGNVHGNIIPNVSDDINSDSLIVVINSQVAMSSNLGDSSSSNKTTKTNRHWGIKNLNSHDMVTALKAVENPESHLGALMKHHMKKKKLDVVKPQETDGDVREQKKMWIKTKLKNNKKQKNLSSVPRRTASRMIFKSVRASDPVIKTLVFKTVKSLMLSETLFKTRIFETAQRKLKLLNIRLSEEIHNLNNSDCSSGCLSLLNLYATVKTKEPNLKLILSVLRLQSCATTLYQHTLSNVVDKTEEIIEGFLELKEIREISACMYMQTTTVAHNDAPQKLRPLIIQLIKYIMRSIIKRSQFQGADFFLSPFTVEAKEISDASQKIREYMTLLGYERDVKLACHSLDYSG